MDVFQSNNRMLLHTSQQHVPSTATESTDVLHLDHRTAQLEDMDLRFQSIPDATILDGLRYHHQLQHSWRSII